MPAAPLRPTRTRVDQLYRGSSGPPQAASRWAPTYGRERSNRATWGAASRRPCCCAQASSPIVCRLLGGG
eukprot:7361068-Alexandrium_andersonii.AAC.1